MRICGVDFTSAPRRAKPITVASGVLKGNTLALEGVERIESFPDNVFAGVFAFRPAELYQVESAAEKVPVKVSF